MPEVRTNIIGITMEHYTADWNGFITSVCLHMVAGVWWRLGVHGCRRRGFHLLLVGPCPVLIALRLVLFLLILASLCFLLAVLLTLGVHHLQQRDSVTMRP